MKIKNVHRRQFDATPTEIGALIDSLASSGDKIWPGHRWPRLKLDRGLTSGSRGGHGPIRYRVESFASGREVTFRFERPRGLQGTHRFTVDVLGDRAGLTHIIEAQAKGKMVLAWPLAIRPLHDALIEDALDKAQQELSGQHRPDRKLGPYVRLLRRVMR